MMNDTRHTTAETYRHVRAHACRVVRALLLFIADTAHDVQPGRVRLAERLLGKRNGFLTDIRRTRAFRDSDYDVTLVAFITAWAAVVVIPADRAIRLVPRRALHVLRHARLRLLPRSLARLFGDAPARTPPLSPPATPHTDRDEEKSREKSREKSYCCPIKTE